jgi:AraC-like DNA-binding protein
MSRSPFAARFRALVGTPPLAYLGRWRLHLSTTLLQNQQLAVRAVAERVGYESEAAFNKAFKRRFHASPGAYRKDLAPDGPANGDGSVTARDKDARAREQDERS